MRLNSYLQGAVAGLSGLFALALLLAVASPAPAAPAESRDQYVAMLDPVCLKDYNRTTPLLRGMQRRIERGRYADAARRVARATRIFDGTIRRTRAIEPTPADRQIVNRWFRQLKIQSRYLHRMVKLIKTKKKPRIYRFQRKIMRNTAKANNIVFLFDFKHCLLPAGI